MTLDQIILNVENLKGELEFYLPLTDEEETRLWEKLRLDWNYYSSKVEDLGISFNELQEVLIRQGKLPKKDSKGSKQIQGHDAAITRVKEHSLTDDPITEIFIKELHSVLLQEPYLNKAVTEQGLPTTKTIIIGDYKVTENVINTGNDGKLQFASSIETRFLMPELVMWCNEEMNAGRIHPIRLAAEFHCRFLKIHPFDDGNGRMARLLSNLILLKKGYYPFIIETDDKGEYLISLYESDNGDYDGLAKLIGTKVIKGIRAAIDILQGGNQNSKTDLEKKIILLTKQLEDNYMRVSKTRQVAGDVINNVYNPFLQKIDERTKVFSHLFAEEIWCYLEEPNAKGIPWMYSIGSLDHITRYFSQIVAIKDSYHSFKAAKIFQDFREKNNVFKVEIAFKIFFKEFTYKIMVSVGFPLENSGILKTFKKIFEKDQDFESGAFSGFEYDIAEVDYANKISSENIDEWANKLGHRLFDYVNNKVKKAKKV